MTQNSLLERIKQGVETWNQWREQNGDVALDLSKVDLRGVDLKNANLHHACLQDAKLQFTKLQKANLEGANLAGARFLEANLYGACLRNANLTGASLMESNLQCADLENADLRGVQFNENVLLDQANLKGANLSTATGMTSNQIKSAVVDAQTQLPEYLTEEMDDEFLLQF